MISVPTGPRRATQRARVSNILRTVVIALGLVALTGVAAVAQSAAAAQVDAAETAPLAGKAAPDFTRTDLDGKSRALSAYRGKVILLNFWATWCEPCLSEIPRFSAWQQRYGPSGLQILGVAMDDELQAVRQLAQRDHLAYPVIMGDAQLGQLYGGILGLPLSYLIDAQGRVVARYRGEPDLKQMERRLRVLLPRPAAP
jgi:cytochrome c biogenesis protein CcmG/thiol:disulfide interchange protein DsbE